MKKIIFPHIPFENVGGVLIDLDNTLYSFDDANEYALYKVHRYLKSHFPIAFDAFKTTYRTYWQGLFDTLGEVPSAHCRYTMFQKFLEDNHVEKPYAHAQKMEMIYFKNLIKKIKPDAKALTFLKECKKRGIPVCVVTDLYANIQVRKLNRLKLTPYIDFVVANDEVGVDKPHRKMFERALDKIKIAPEAAIMIGDHPQKDLDGAKALGIRTYLVTFDK